jgi:NADPH:quinone reductase-like Zn-dependent oxidoreductase
VTSACFREWHGSRHRSSLEGSRTRFREGDEVFGEAWGTFAEEVRVPLKDLVRKPHELDFVTAAALPMPGLVDEALEHVREGLDMNQKGRSHGKVGLRVG